MSNSVAELKPVETIGHKVDVPRKSTREDAKRDSGEEAKPRAADYCELHKPHSTANHTLIFYILVVSTLLAGWYLRGEEFLVAESGPGYALGIVGGSMMLLLLLYPLRKKARFMRNLGQIKHWFRGHMLLGVLGPVLVLFHSNFSIGSMNSTVVLFATLLVAGSGLVGRYIYTQIHYGLYGRQLTLKELQEDLDHKKNTLVFVLKFAPKLRERLLAFDDSALKTRDSFFSSLWGYITISLRGRWVHLSLLFALRRTLDVAAKRSEWSDLERQRKSMAARKHISIHIKSALRIAEFSVFERFMSLWHLLHFPLFIMLVVAGIIHILAVHMY